MGIYILIAILTFIIYLANVARTVECVAYGLILFASGFLICFYMVESYYKVDCTITGQKKDEPKEAEEKKTVENKKQKRKKAKKK